MQLLDNIKNFGKNFRNFLYSEEKETDDKNLNLRDDETSKQPKLRPIRDVEEPSRISPKKDYIIFEVKNKDDWREVAGYLKEDCIVTLNFRYIDNSDSTARETMDSIIHSLEGFIEAIGGKMERLDENNPALYVLAPENRNVKKVEAANQIDKNYLFKS